MERQAAEEWIRMHVRPVGPISVVHERPWSTVMRVPTPEGTAWFKACGDTQAFEPLLTAGLFARWPGLVPEVLAHDGARSWLLLGDAGTRIGDLGNDPELWLRVLPRYAELQRGETVHAGEHLNRGVPDLRVAVLPARYRDLFEEDLPISAEERRSLESFASTFDRMCGEVASHDVPDSIQHDDLHMNNVFLRDGCLRVLDWGDASVSHPFASLLATFRFLEERNGLTPGDPWLGRLRDAYLEPWGGDRTDLFSVIGIVGGFAHAIAALRQRAVLTGAARSHFDNDLAVRLRRALQAVA